MCSWRRSARRTPPRWSPPTSSASPGSSGRRACTCSRSLRSASPCRRRRQGDRPSDRQLRPGPGADRRVRRRLVRGVEPESTRRRRPSSGCFIVLARRRAGRAILGAWPTRCAGVGSPSRAALIGSLLVVLLVLGGVLAGALQALDTAGSGRAVRLRCRSARAVPDLLPDEAPRSSAHWPGWRTGAAGSSRRRRPRSAGKAAIAAVLLGGGLAARRTWQKASPERRPVDRGRTVQRRDRRRPALLLLAGALGGLAMVLGASKAGAERPDTDDDEGLTLNGVLRGRQSQVWNRSWPTSTARTPCSTSAVRTTEERS